MKWKALAMMALLLGWSLHADVPAALEAAVLPAAGAAVQPAVAAEAAEEQAKLKDGYALLNSLLGLFDNLYPEKKGEGKAPLSGFELVDSRLSQLGADSKAAFEAGLIDKIFYNRYLRLLTTYKLVVTPVLRGGLLKNLFLRAFDDFTWNVICERWNWDDPDAAAKIAAAMEEEFVQLMTYLDTRQKREELKKKIGSRILPPPPAKKKAEEKKPE